MCYRILRVGRSPHRSHKPGASAVRICHPHPFQVHASLTLNECLPYRESLDSFSSPYSLDLMRPRHWTDFFTALAQLDRALDYESGGWEFESLRWCQFSSCSSKVEHTADNRATLDRYHPRGPQLTTNLKCCIIDFYTGAQHETC